MDKYNTLPPHIKPEGSHLRYHCSNGRSFIFDRCDLPFFVGTMCTVDERGDVTANRKKDLISHILLGVGRDSVVDHINGDPFDNRRSNLRVATIFQNHWNYKISERNSTGFKGIYPDKKTEGFHARICEHGRRHYLGLFSSAIEAAKAYDQAARSYFGEFATLNFPEHNERSCHRTGVMQHG
ncbi:MAG: HNH endonuclease [Clostridia bacterium]|nr:HNH endonuclease [Clostridia bacterium]